MADAKLSSLPSANVVNKGDLFYLVQNNNSLNVTAGTVFASITDPTLAGNVLIGGNTQVLTQSGEIDITVTRTDLVGGGVANTAAIASGAVLPATIYLYTPGVSATGRGLYFTNGSPFTQQLYVTYANNKIQLSRASGYITYPPSNWGQTIGLSPFPNGLYFVKGSSYIFDVSDPTNTGNVLSFSSSIDGTNTQGSDYTANVVRNGTPGTAGANIIFTPANVNIDAGGLQYLDMPNGSDGQLKIITLTSTKGGSYVLSSNIKNDVAIQFRLPGDSVMLLYTTDSWTIMGSTPGFATTFSGTTDNVQEGQKLYFSNARARSAISAGDNTIIYNATTGTIRANILALSNVNLANIIPNTDSVQEGQTNLYFTNVRANAVVQPSIAELRALTLNHTANVIYVAKNGNDANSGNTELTAYANIHTALSRATEWTTVFVKSGDYTLYNQPVTIPKRVALVGDNLRTTTIRPANVYMDMFYVNIACYVTGITFRDHQAPSAVFSYNPDGSAGYITTSPYIQNCSSITTTGTGLRVDGRYVSGLRSMVMDAYTQTNQGGIGVHLLNRGYAQLVSVFTICCHIGVYCQNGGFCSITNSNTSFGTYALYADGVSDPEYYGQVVNTTQTQNITIGNLIKVPAYGDSVLFANYNQASCYRDLGLIIDSLVTDLAYSSNTQSNFAGLQYWSQTTSAIPNQSPETVSAINYVKNLTSNIAANIAVSPYQTNVNQKFYSAVSSNAYIANVINTEFFIVSNIIQNGTYDVTNQIVSNGFPATTDQNILNTANIIQQNLSFISAEVVAYVNTAYPGFWANSYNFIDAANAQAKCSRDAVNIVQSVVFDLVNGGNRQAIQAGIYYYNYSTGSATTSNFAAQQLQTSLAYQYMGGVIANVLLKVAVTPNIAPYQNFTGPSVTANEVANVLNNINLITNIIQNGPNVSAPKTSIVYNTITNPNLKNGANLIIENKDFIRAEVVNYINTNWVNISNGTQAFYTVISASPLVSNTSTITILEPLQQTINANTYVSFHQASYISASGQTMEYVGAGDDITTALPYLGGVPIQANEVTQSRGGKVFFTSVDQLGDFRIGTGLVINRSDGTISGRTFNKALFAVMTPYMLAIEG